MPPGIHAVEKCTRLSFGAKVIIALLVPSLVKHHPFYPSPNQISVRRSFIMGIFGVSATLSSDVLHPITSLLQYSFPLKARIKIQACHHNMLAGAGRV